MSWLGLPIRCRCWLGGRLLWRLLEGGLFRLGVWRGGGGCGALMLVLMLMVLMVFLEVVHLELEVDV